jgi:uncharacterized protein DUF4129
VKWSVIALGAALTMCATPVVAAATDDIASIAATLDRAAARKNPARSDVPVVRLSGNLEAWLTAGLDAARSEKKPRDRARDLSALAASLRRAAALERAASISTPRDVGATVKKILSDPAYAVAHAAPPQQQKESWLEILLKRLAELWSKFLGRAAASGSTSVALGDIIAIIAVAAAAAALVYLIVRVALMLVARRARQRGEERIGAEIETPGDPDASYAAARLAASEGSYGRAVALLFQAALVVLDRSGRVAYDPARTAGEYRRAVRQTDARAASPFDELARAFTDVAYADKNATEREWMSADASYGRFTPLVGVRH